MTRLSTDCSIRVYLFTNIHLYSTKTKILQITQFRGNFCSIRETLVVGNFTTYSANSYWQNCTLLFYGFQFCEDQTGILKIT